jgi:hypothetical protein
MLPPAGERPPLLLAYKQRDEAERELYGECWIPKGLI